MPERRAVLAIDPQAGMLCGASAVRYCARVAGSHRFPRRRRDALNLESPSDSLPIQFACLWVRTCECGGRRATLIENRQNRGFDGGGKLNHDVDGFSKHGGGHLGGPFRSVVRSLASHGIRFPAGRTNVSTMDSLQNEGSASVRDRRGLSNHFVGDTHVPPAVSAGCRVLWPD